MPTFPAPTGCPAPRRLARALATTALLAVLAAPAAGAQTGAQTGAPFAPPLPPERLTPEEIAEAAATRAAEATAARRAEEAAELALLRGLPLAAETATATETAAPSPAAPPAATAVATAETAGTAGLETLEPAAGPALGAVAEAGRTLRALPIGALRRSANGLTLNGRQGRLDLALPVADGTRIDAVTMRLMWRSADTLAAERSRLWLYLNGEPVAELPMGGAGDEMTADVGLPTGALTAGANRLSFVAHQEHIAGCAPEDLAMLWTQIDATNSYLVVEGAAGRAQTTLAAFDDPAGPLGASSLPVRIAVAGVGEGAGSLRLGGLIAAGLALRGDERPLRVEPIGLDTLTAGRSASPGPVAASGGPIVTVGAVTVVAGTVDQLRGVVGDALLAAVDGPWLARHDALADNGGAVLVVTGRTAEEVAAAARALANPAFALPQTAASRVDQVPGLPRPADGTVVAPAQTVRFGDLDMAVRNAEGSAERTEVRFDLPPDVFVADNRRARIRLSFAYGEGLSSDSLLNVVVNGAYVGAVPLTRADGDLVERLPIAFPAHHLRPGRNVVTIEPVTGAADRLGCAWRPIDTARVDVFPDSEIELPAMARAARLPDLGLAAATGYPFVRPAGLARLVPADDGADTLAALWTLTARIAQVAGSPAIAEAIGPARPDLPGDVVLVGRGAALDRAWLAGAPSEVRTVLARTGDGARPAPSAPGAPGPLAPPPLDGGAPAAGLDRPVEPPPLRAALLDADVLGALPAELLPALMAAGDMVERGFETAMVWRDDDARMRAGAPTHDALVAAFARPDGSGTVTVLAADGGPQLRRAAHELVAPEMWDRLSGDFATWRVGAGGLSTATVAPPLFVADGLDGWDQRVLFVNSLLAERPGLWFLISLAVLFGFGAVTSAALGWRDRRADG